MALFSKLWQALFTGALQSSAAMVACSGIFLAILYGTHARLFFGTAQAKNTYEQHRIQTHLPCDIASFSAASWQELSLDPQASVALSGLRMQRIHQERNQSGEIMDKVPSSTPNSTPCATLLEAETKQGYGGTMVLLMVVVEEKIYSMDVLRHSETPGIGDRIMPHRSNFLQRLALFLNGDPEFDGLSGATISSHAVMNAAKAAYDAYRLQNQNTTHHHPQPTSTLQ